MSLAARRIRPIPKPDAELGVFHMVKDQQPGLWLYVRGVQDRIRRFCERYPTEYDPDNLCDLLEQNFVSSFPQVTAFIALRDLHLVGHLLAGIEGHGKITVCNILQYEIDKGVHLPDRIMRPAFSQIENWASRRGAREIQIQVRNEALARAFSRFYGFERLRILLRKEI